MNPNNRIGESNNNKTKAMAAILIAAALLSGLSLINIYYPPAMAQQNMTGANATTTTTTAPSTTVAGDAESACATATQTGGGQNATTGITRGGNQSTSVARMHIEQACLAAQINDTQSVLMNLTLALNALRNITTTAESGGTTASQ
jgi:hypothetical protein